MTQDATRYGIVTNYRIFILFDYTKGEQLSYQFDFMDMKDNEEKMKEFVKIFSRASLLEDKFVENLYEASVVEEKQFTKEFYKLFHETRLMLIKEFKMSDLPNNDNNNSIHYAQLLLNRLMFILFAEGTGKLKRRLFEDRILNMLKSGALPMSEHSTYISDTIKGLFVSLDKGATKPIEIFGFNGGLFKEQIPNEISFKDFRDEHFFSDVYQQSALKKIIKLDQYSSEIIAAYDELSPIIKNILLMASFDFNTEVNVNILGHIFEQSISDLESLKVSNESRRKKEGIFYTPEFITEYTCRNTIIPYLSKSGTNNIEELVEEYASDISVLEQKFKSIKILDPACGSGAFLIKAVDILLQIYKEIEAFKLEAGHYGKDSQPTLLKWNEEEEARDIIQSNIYGVDINEESVDITKLSLFLKMSNDKKKLVNLSGNIKCGNSLIEDLKIDKNAFDWNDRENGFGKIMSMGGFNIIIGNPPYGAEEEGVKEDSYQMFYKKGFSLLSQDGIIGFVTPDTWTINDNGVDLRNYIKNNLTITKFYDVYKPFEDAKDVWCHISIFKNKKADKDSKYKVSRVWPYNLTIFNFEMAQDALPQGDRRWFIYINPKINQIFKNVEGLTLKARHEWHRGISPTPNPKNLTNEKTERPVVGGEDIGRYSFNWNPKYLIKDYVNNGTIRKLNASEKIVIQRIRTNSTDFSSRWLVASLVTESYIPIDSLGYILQQESSLNLYCLLAIVDSALMNFYYKLHYTDKNVKPIYLMELPIPQIDYDQQKVFIELVEVLVQLNKDFYKMKDTVFKLLKQEFSIVKISKKLRKFYDLDFDAFIKELKLNKLNIEKKEELLRFFEKNKEECSNLRDKIDSYDKKIDELVYTLYNVTNDDEKFIENSLKAKSSR